MTLAVQAPTDAQLVFIWKLCDRYYEEKLAINEDAYLARLSTAEAERDAARHEAKRILREYGDRWVDAERRASEHREQAQVAEAERDEARQRGDRLHACFVRCSELRQQAVAERDELRTRLQQQEQDSGGARGASSTAPEPERCDECHGHGYTVGPVCCGNLDRGECRGDCAVEAVEAPREEASVTMEYEHFVRAMRERDEARKRAEVAEQRLQEWVGVAERSRARVAQLEEALHGGCSGWGTPPPGEQTDAGDGASGVRSGGEA